MSKNAAVRVSLYFGEAFEHVTLLEPKVVNVHNLKKWAKDTGFKKQLAEIDQHNLKVFKGKEEAGGKSKSTQDGEELDPADPVPSYVVIKAPGPVFVSLYIGKKYVNTKKIFAGSLMNVGKLREWAMNTGFLEELAKINKADLKVFKGEFDDKKVTKMEGAENLHSFAKLSKCDCEYFVIEAPDKENTKTSQPMLVTGTFFSAKSTRCGALDFDAFGIRHSVYRLAEMFEAAYPPESLGLWYHDKDLKIELVFKSTELAKTFGKCCHNPLISTILGHWLYDSENVAELKQVSVKDYVPLENNNKSAEDDEVMTLDTASTTTSNNKNLSKFPGVEENQSVQFDPVESQPICV